MNSISAQPELYERLRSARLFMDTFYYLPLDLEQISGQAHFSRYHFLRSFKRVYHKTPHQYLTHKRIEQAKVLLSDSHASITEVCFAVGFQSLGSFSTLFNKYAGYSPQIYRERLLKRRQSVPGCHQMLFNMAATAEVSNFQEANP